MLLSSELTINDLTGKLVHSESLDKNETEINMSDYHVGTYIVSLRTPKGILNKKVIKL